MLNLISRTKLSQITAGKNDDFLADDYKNLSFRRGASQFGTLAILRGTETLSIALLLVIILRKWYAPFRRSKTAIGSISFMQVSNYTYP